jgi:bifunctional non-homologous end joining protein LigD
LPLIERKRRLSAFLERSKIDRLMVSEHFGNGAALFQQACDLGLEGIVSKRKDSPYKPSKSNWLKVKCQKLAEYYIIGYVPAGRKNISALRLGQRNGRAFDYVGKVGTGFSNEVSERLRRTLDKKIADMPSLTSKLRKTDTKWVKPESKAKVAFRGITSDGRLRHPSFKGMGD